MMSLYNNAYAYTYVHFVVDFDPLNLQIIKDVNLAEAEYWKSISTSQTLNTKIDDSNKILGFDCGGEQWVYEVCIPIGTFKEMKSSTKLPKDLEILQKLTDLIELNEIPAPCPIEQRWTCSSHSYMSPAYSATKPKIIEKRDLKISNNTNTTTTIPSFNENEELFTWVGIIMYLPLSQTAEQRKMITKKFRDYCKLVDPLVKEYKGYPHWAKLELPVEDLENHEKVSEIKELQNYLKLKYPMSDYNNYRQILDPQGILSNTLVDSLFESKDHSSVINNIDKNSK